MMKQEDLLKKLKEHKPIIVNYGKGYITDKEIKEKAIWDDDKKTYISDTGIWDIKLLIEIAKGEVKNTFIELME